MKHDGPEDYRNRCTLCQGSGWMLEHRLIVRVARESAPPLELSGRLESELEGSLLEEKFAAVGLSAEVVSGERRCSCKRPPAEKPIPPALDRMRVAAGDRD